MVTCPNFANIVRFVFNVNFDVHPINPQFVAQVAKRYDLSIPKINFQIGPVEMEKSLKI